MPVMEQDPTRLELIVYGAQDTIRNVLSPDPPMIGMTVDDPARFGPLPEGSTVRHMTPADIIQAAQTLAEAFEDDPNFSYIIQDDTRRLQRLGHGIAAFVEDIWLPGGEVYVNDNLSAVAAWTPPGEWRVSLLKQLQVMKAMVGKVSPTDMLHLLNAFEFVERKHGEIEERYALGSHYYLAMVGVTPTWQGRGYGGALLKPVLDKCDQEGKAAYLESSTERSVSLYEDNGFEVVAKGRYRGGFEPIHFMVREPNT